MHLQPGLPRYLCSADLKQMLGGVWDVQNSVHTTLPNNPLSRADSTTALSPTQVEMRRLTCPHLPHSLPPHLCPPPHPIRSPINHPLAQAHPQQQTSLPRASTLTDLTISVSTRASRPPTPVSQSTSVHSQSFFSSGLPPCVVHDT